MTNLVKKYLDKNQYSELKDNFEEFYTSHPNYPSVFAITDTFNLLAIENLVVKVPKEQFHMLPDYFLTFLKDEFVMVKRFGKKVVVESENKKIEIGTDGFLMNWSGIVIAVEPNTVQVSKSSKQNPQNFKYGILVLGLTALTSFLNLFSYETLFFVIVSLLGFTIGLLIIQEEFGVKNEAVSKFCTRNSMMSCNSVITSEKSKISGWLHFSDLPILFFGGSLTALVFYSNAVEGIIGLLSVTTTPVVLYSIWIQKFQLKKWCVLCLLVSVILFSEAAFYVLLNYHKMSIAYHSVLQFLFAEILFLTIWMFLKPLFREKQKLEQSNKELVQFKRNFKLFKTLSDDLPNKNAFENLKGILFGNSDADVCLDLIVSPSCSHCHEAFKDAYQLQQSFPEKVAFQILFNINPENKDNPYRFVVDTILAIAYHDVEKAKTAILDWHIRKIGLEAWKEKWQSEKIDMRANHQILMQYEWCAKNNFNYTPVKIINGKLFPKEYNINELKFFLNDISHNEYYEVAKAI